jgi:uncharacterized protein involved in response to NO
MAIAALWLAGRILVLTPFSWLSTIVNAAFPLAVAIGIGIPLVQAGNRRNYFFIGLLAIMSGAVMAVHIAAMAGWHAAAWTGLRTGLDVVLLIIAIMTGRVVPMFTNNAIPTAGARRHQMVERAAIAILVLLAILDAAQMGGALLAAVLVVACLVHAARWLLWNPQRTTRVPLVWVLHAAYAWIPIHLALRAASALDLAPGTLAWHALTVGAIGGMIIGMMTRTARGHTGRMLVADGWDTACYVLVLIAAVVRVFGPLIISAWYMTWIISSALAWSLAFALYAVRYGPSLIRSRADGKPG